MKKLTAFACAVLFLGLMVLVSGVAMPARAAGTAPGTSGRGGNFLANILANLADIFAGFFDGSAPAAAPTPNASATVAHHTVQQFTTDLLQALKAYRSASAENKQAALSNLVAAAQARKNAMRGAAQNDPKGFLLAALPAAVLQHMPADIASMVEQKKSEQGAIDVIGVDPVDGPDHIEFYLNTPHGKVQLHFAEDPRGEGVPTNYLTGDIVSANGIELGNDMALSAKDAKLIKDPLPNTFGPQRTLVILVNFQDEAVQPVDTAFVNNIFFGASNSVNNYWLENSYQQTSAVGDVAGWFTIPISYTTCDTASIANDANTAAQNAGYALSNYQHRIYVFANNACSWWGYSMIGGSPSQSWIRDYTNSASGVEVLNLSHELGHALGLYHSHDLDCGTVPYAPSGCTMTEYGDAHDVMGNDYYYANPHYSAFQKERLGWLNYGTEPPIQTITASGNYTIAPFEVPGAGTKALKILQSASTNSYYYVEFRQAIGNDGYLSGNTNVTNGVLVHIASPTNANSNDLLNMTPGGSWSTPALDVGKSYTDSATGITIAPVSVNASSGAVVNVSFGSISCVRAAPTVSISPTSQSGSVGQTLNYTVSVTNNNNSGCAATAFNLAATALPTGFTATWSAPSIPLASGGTGSATAQITSAAGTPDSSNSFSVSATDSASGGLSGSAQATYVVFTPVIDTTAPTVSITNPANGASITSAKSVAIQVSASDNVGVTKVEIYIDGTLKATDTAAPYTYKWTINKTVASGQHTITAKAYDAAGNNASASVMVTK